MLPLRLVMDTNVLISAALKPDSLQRTAFLLAISKPARLYVSRPILDEYAEVLARPELRIRKGARLQLLDLIRNRGVLVAPRVRLVVAGDPDDNIFIECADAARADYLITGNRRHFPKFWKSTKVVTAREFVELAAPHLLSP
jgi:putative PIN family toxin of toxin-antitoxin system